MYRRRARTGRMIGKVTGGLELRCQLATHFLLTDCVTYGAKMAIRSVTWTAGEPQGAVVGFNQPQPLPTKIGFLRNEAIVMAVIPLVCYHAEILHAMQANVSSVIYDEGGTLLPQDGNLTMRPGMAITDHG